MKETTPTGPAQEPSDTEMLDWLERNAIHTTKVSGKFVFTPWMHFDLKHSTNNFRQAVAATMLAEKRRRERPPATAQGEKL